MKKAIVLLSGGVDSTVTLYHALDKGYDCSVLIFDYKQRHKVEVKQAIKLAEKLNLAYKVVKIELPWGGSALTDKNIAVPKNQKLDGKNIPATYVPARNSIFLSFAFSFAESIKASKIFIGAHIQDYSGYPDCRPEFLESIEKSIAMGLANSKIKIEAPLLKLNKTQIIKKGLKYGIDFSQTWSCYSGGKEACGVCDSCLYRIRAFNELGLKDPVIKVNKKRSK